MMCFQAKMSMIRNLFILDLWEVVGGSKTGLDEQFVTLYVEIKFCMEIYFLLKIICEVCIIFLIWCC